MSFMAQHYHCCPNDCGDATMDKQDQILTALAAVGTAVAAIAVGGGTASETKQDEILSEIDKLTGGLRTY